VGGSEFRAPRQGGIGRFLQLVHAGFADRAVYLVAMMDDDGFNLAQRASELHFFGGVRDEESEDAVEGSTHLRRSGESASQEKLADQRVRPLESGSMWVQQRITRVPSMIRKTVSAGNSAIPACRLVQPAL
jgi:hypothetical protein